MIFHAVSLRFPSMVLAGALVLAGCASGPRFKDQPIVWRADDARNIPEPDEREFLGMQYFPRVLVTRQLTRAMEVPDREPAHNTNALDEVPNSTWFTNRIGARTPTPAEAARGAAVQGPPKQPLSVVAGKSGGGNPGFFAEDATGRKFLIKFDTKENPEMQTGGNISCSTRSSPPRPGYRMAPFGPRRVSFSTAYPRGAFRLRARGTTIRTTGWPTSIAVSSAACGCLPPG